MAIHGAGAGPGVSPAPATPYRAAGVALGRFAMADGRPGDYEWEARMMVEHFVPGTVPFLTRHGGLPIAYVDTLRADGERLPDGSWPPGSIMLNGPEDRTRRRRYYRGTLRPGPNLVGIALSDAPAARMSVAWLVRAEDG